MLPYYFYLLVLSFLFFSNFGFFFLSEEVLVFSSSLLFVFLVFLSFRASARRYFFLRAYQVYVCFLYALLAYIKALSSVHLVLESLIANLFLASERKGLAQQAIVHLFTFSFELGECFFLWKAPRRLLPVPQSLAEPLFHVSALATLESGSINKGVSCSFF